MKPLTNVWGGAWLVVAVLSAGCGPAHLSAYEPKHRTIADDAPAADGTKAASGSLWAPNDSAGLFVDARAFRVNDVVVVRVEEVADAERSADTDTARHQGIAAGVSAVPLIGPLATVVAGTNLNVDATGDIHGDQEFKGGGRTGRRERLVATVTTVVKQVLANGNLFIEGHRAILVNNEEHHLYVSGIVRPLDIDQENSLPSSRIAEAEIEFVGKGALSDKGGEGWLARFLSFISP